ncbi:MAG: methyltransferase domain-containing protein [Pseudomonadota bacterium]
MKGSSIRLRSVQGKKLVSFLRGGDYAHPGEVEAINRAFAHIPKISSNLILDVGCGLGGTADYLHQSGFGHVTGIDIETESIIYAQKHHPSCTFYQADIKNLHASAIASNKYDIICIFNAFYEFQNQTIALKELRKLAHDETQFIIFDYVDLSHGESGFIDTSNSNETSNPVSLDGLAKMLKETGWDNTEYIDLRDEYIEWYNQLLEKLSEKKENIVLDFGQEKFDQALTRYTFIRDEIFNGKITGGIFIINASSG